MILKISLRAKGGVPKTLLEQKHRLNLLYFPQNTLMLTESREEFSDLHSIFRLRALRYWVTERRTSHEPNWLNWVRLMLSTAFDSGLSL